MTKPKDTTRRRKAMDTTSMLALKAGEKFADPGCKGLRIEVSSTQRVFMRFRLYRHGKQDEMPVGEFIRPIPKKGDPKFAAHTSLEQARTKVTQLRDANKYLDVDPRHAAIGRAPSTLTLREDMESYLAVKKRVWKNECQVTNLRNRMELHAKPLLDRITVEIAGEHISDQLTKILDSKSHGPRKDADMISTAHQVRYWLLAIFGYAMRKGKNMQRWSKDAANPASLDQLPIEMPKRKKRHHGRLPIVTDEHGGGLQDFYAFTYLHPHPKATKTRKALLFLLLTLCPRTNEVRQATWDQMHLDRDKPIWRIPDPIMKVSKDRDATDGDRIIPLSRSAIELLLGIRPDNPRPFDYVFPGRKKGRPLSESSMLWILKQWRQTATVHGLRSNMTTFVADNWPEFNEAAEIALDHEPGTKVRRDYNAATLIPARRILAERWAAWLEEKLPNRAPRDPLPIEYIRDLAPSQWVLFDQLLRQMRGLSPQPPSVQIDGDYIVPGQATADPAVQQPDKEIYVGIRRTTHAHNQTGNPPERNVEVANLSLASGGQDHRQKARPLNLRRLGKSKASHRRSA